MGFFSSDTYSKSYLFGLGQRWGINAEAGHLIEKGIPVMSNGDCTYSYGLNVDLGKWNVKEISLHAQLISIWDKLNGI